MLWYKLICFSLLAKQVVKVQFSRCCVNRNGKLLISKLVNDLIMILFFFGVSKVNSSELTECFNSSF